MSKDFETVVADSRDGKREGHIYFWLQTSPRKLENCTPDSQIGEDCTRQSDYILTGDWNPDYELDTRARNGETNVNFKLTSSEPINWTCLGRGINVKYDCLPIDQTLKQVAAVGFLMAPAISCPTEFNNAGTTSCRGTALMQSYPNYFSRGEFAFRDLRIILPVTRANAATLITYADLLTEKVGMYFLKGSIPIRNGDGHGLQFTVGTIDQPLRIGLSMPGESLAGDCPQIYLLPPSLSRGISQNQFAVWLPNSSGERQEIQTLSRFKAGDTFSILFVGDRQLLLKNDEVAFDMVSPCRQEDASCQLIPFVAGEGEIFRPDLYIY